VVAISPLATFIRECFPSTLATLAGEGRASMEGPESNRLALPSRERAARSRALSPAGAGRVRGSAETIVVRNYARQDTSLALTAQDRNEQLQADPVVKESVFPLLWRERVAEVRGRVRGQCWHQSLATVLLRSPLVTAFLQGREPLGCK